MDFGQNLEALLNGYELSTYQKTLAKQEFECWKEEYVRMASDLSKLRQDAVMQRSEQLISLLEKLLENNMCSHAGDELIEQMLKEIANCT